VVLALRDGEASQVGLPDAVGGVRREQRLFLADVQIESIPHPTKERLVGLVV
jgi:hypothetical protein